MSGTFQKILYILIFLFCLAVSIAVILLPTLPPPNPFWALTSGYYQYDPRRETPPKDLMRELPEESLHYFLDATLKLCSGAYPPSLHRHVKQYEVESVEYFGKTDYHAFSYVHTRLYFTDGASVLATFRFEAGHNETDMLLSLGDVSTIRTGSWMALGSLLRDPDIPPPGWTTYLEDQPLACSLAGDPFSMDEWQSRVQ